MPGYWKSIDRNMGMPVRPHSEASATMRGAKRSRRRIMSRTIACAPGDSTRHGEPENMSIGERHSICRWRMKSSSCQSSPRTPLPSLPHVPPPTRSATTNG